MTTKVKVLLLSVTTMTIWGIAGASIAFVFGFSPEYGVGAWLFGVAVGAAHSAQLIGERKVNCQVFSSRDIHKTGDL